MAQFSLSWESHKSNICSGLSTLQQNGEFVDMTIAADGHHVKVHKMVMSLVSPYLKDIISSAAGDHPVIFLNKVSYATLCAILEYIYTGEVLVGKDNLTELIEAGRDLHIRGLEDMKVELPSQAQFSQSQSVAAQNNEGQPLTGKAYFAKTHTETPWKKNSSKNIKPEQYQDTTEVHAPSDSDMPPLDDSADHQTFDDYSVMETDPSVISVTNTTRQSDTTPTKDIKALADTQIQYTISNQGALQMILNRYMYYLRYTSRKEQHGHRSWKCINYTKKGTNCPATVITRNDVVIKRFGAHNHTFHDKQILRKVRDNAVFSALTEAEQKGNHKKMERLQDPAHPTSTAQGPGDTTDHTDAE